MGGGGVGGLGGSVEGLGGSVEGLGSSVEGLGGFGNHIGGQCRSEKTGSSEGRRLSVILLREFEAGTIICVCNSDRAHWLDEFGFECIRKEQGSDEGSHCQDNSECHHPEPHVEENGEEIGWGDPLGCKDEHGEAHNNQFRDCIDIDRGGDAFDGHSDMGFVGHGAFAWFGIVLDWFGRQGFIRRCLNFFLF